ncbi:MAG: endonuclease/exonuclease/phosphatase family protein [Proteobacteria bacterium]|nr:endonuclease/exonuclease/phosphatase family protein [Pseudomonadota bacterium]
MRARIATLNSWKCDGDYDRRLTTMGDLLETLRPDIVLLQEVFAVPDKGINTALSLGGRLGMDVAYHAAREKPRSFAGSMVLSQSGMAILSNSPIIHASAIPLPTVAEDGERIAQLSVIGGDLCLSVLNVHLCHLRERRDLRQLQYAEGLGVLLESDPDRVIIAGDFNDNADSAWLTEAVYPDATPVRNSRAGHLDLEKTPTLIDPAQNATACLDHIHLLGDTAAVATLSHHGDTSVSDHCLVMAEIQWR